MATKSSFLPLPSIMDVAGAMAPADFDFQIVAQDDPNFAQAIQDADYFMGFRASTWGSRSTTWRRI